MAGSVTGDREEMLCRIRSALGGAQSSAQSHKHPSAQRAEFNAYLPAVGGSLQERLALFASRCEGLRTGFVIVDAIAGFPDALRKLIAHEPGGIAYHDHSLIAPVVAAMDRPLTKTSVGYSPAELERCTIGVTTCTALIAQTGSVMITSDADGGRALSIIAHHHIVLATAIQLVADLPTAYAVIDPSRASMMSLISGPSRTGDIERILVLGAHGPRRLTVILAMNEESDA